MKPQDVTNKPGENAIFMVFGLTDADGVSEKVKELCGSFAALVKSMRNRFPDRKSTRLNSSH